MLNEDLLTLVSEEFVPGNWMWVNSLGSLAFCAGQKDNMDNQTVEMPGTCILHPKTTPYKELNTLAWVEHRIFCCSDSRDHRKFVLGYFCSLAGAYAAHRLSY